jgi:hypothetical protein
MAAGKQRKTEADGTIYAPKDMPSVTYFLHGVEPLRFHHLPIKPSNYKSIRGGVSGSMIQPLLTDPIYPLGTRLTTSEAFGTLPV